MKNYHVTIPLLFSLFLSCLTYTTCVLIPQLYTAQDVIAFLPKSVEDLRIWLHARNKQGRDAIASIVIQSPHERTYETVMKVLDKVIFERNITLGLLSLISMIHPDQGLRTEAHRFYIDIDRFESDPVFQDDNLYNIFNDYVKNFSFYEELSCLQISLLHEMLRVMRCSGFHLPEIERIHFHELINKCRTAENIFQRAIDYEIVSYHFYPEELVGVPDCVLESLDTDTKGNYIVKLDSATYSAIIHYCAVENTRHIVYKAFNDRAADLVYSDQFRTILQLRQEIAQMLGYPDTASYALFNHMAQTPDNLQEFIDRLSSLSFQKVNKEYEKIVAHAGHMITFAPSGEINPWDVAYLFQYYYDTYVATPFEEIRDFFPLEHVLAQLIKTYEDFFAIKCVLLPIQGLWHKDIALLAVYKDTELLGHVLLDLYSRKGKCSGACTIPIVNAQKSPIGNVPALCAIVTNFQKTLSDESCLLTLSDLKTFFHEFGHAFHILFGATEYAFHAGPGIPRDFAELPSQMFELWLEQPQHLKRLSKHYKTGEQISDYLIESIVSYDTFLDTINIKQYLFFSQFSLDIHRFNGYLCIKNHHKRLCNTFMPEIVYLPNNYMSEIYRRLVIIKGSPFCYEYLWARVFAYDVFSAVKDYDYSPEIAQRFAEEILAPGTSQKPAQLLHNFLGREPQERAFLRSRGFIN